MCGSLKMKKNCMRNIIFFAFIFLVGLFATSCHNNMITPVAGSLVVTVPGGRAVSADVVSYKVDITGPEEKTQTVNVGEVVTFSDVAPGSYTVTVSGLDKDAKTIFIGIGTATVEAGKSASVPIVLELNLTTSGVMMWNGTSDDSGNMTYTGSIAPYDNYTSSSVTLSLNDEPVYCFDHRGNIYVQESADETTVVKKYL